MTRNGEKVAAGHANTSPDGEEEWRDAGLAERADRQARLAARVGLPRFAIRLLGKQRVRELLARG